MTEVDWSDRIGDLLTDGEHVVASEPVAESDVVVTNRRVITLTPTADGPNYRTVDRPNVDGVHVGRHSDGSLLPPAVLLVLGGVFVGLGLTFDLAGLLTVPETPAGGSLGIAEALETIKTALALVDDIALALGGLLVLVGLALVGRWLYSRDRVLVIDVAGGDDLYVPLPPEESTAAEGTKPDPLDPSDETPAEPDPGPVERVRRAIAEA